MEKKWIYPKEKKDVDLTANRTLSIVERLLILRGFKESEEREEFLAEKPKRTYDPFLLKDMDKAVSCILDALDKEYTFCIYGDYDADGVTSCSLLLEILGKLTSDLFFYIPSRFEEGYGLNKAAIDKIKEQGANLIITVDCGSTSVEEVEYAKNQGLNVIVTDHHTIVDKVPNCILINPKKPDCQYPFRELSGCGVAFKLAQAIQRTLKKNSDPRAALLTKKELNAVLDLVAISTIGDIVPLVDENRTLVKYGMKCIRRGKRQGLKQLIEGIGLSKENIKSENVAYSIVPHLNAAGRMDSAKIGVELLVASGESRVGLEKIKKTVANLLEKNQERKRVQEETFFDCMQMVERMDQEDLFLLIDAEKAHEGIAGIVAGKFKDRFGKPTALVTLCSDGIYYKGTGRSVEGVNLYQLLDTQSSLFEKFGGHAGACGFLLKKEKVGMLRHGLNEGMKKLLAQNPFLLCQNLLIDERLAGEDLTEKLVSELACFEPFGLNNEKPLFLMEQLKVMDIRYMGDNNQHVRFKGVTVDGVLCDFLLFARAADYKEKIKMGMVVDVVGYPDVNHFRGNTTVQFVVHDIK